MIGDSIPWRSLAISARACLIWALFLIGLGPAGDVIGASAANRKVLILYSWYEGQPWQAGVMAGVRERLRQAPEADRTDIYTESMDASRFRDPGSMEGFENYLLRKYAAVQFDAVITES